jgi:hypothetical protein
MLRDITFSQYVSAMPGEVDEHQPAIQGSRKCKATRGFQLWRRTQGHARLGKLRQLRKRMRRGTYWRVALAGFSILLVEMERLTEENHSRRANK